MARKQLLSFILLENLNIDVDDMLDEKIAEVFNLTISETYVSSPLLRQLSEDS